MRKSIVITPSTKCNVTTEQIVDRINDILAHSPGMFETEKTHTVGFSGGYEITDYETGEVTEYVDLGTVYVSRRPNAEYEFIVTLMVPWDWDYKYHRVAIITTTAAFIKKRNWGSQEALEAILSL